ncbi:plasmid stabilization protein [Streptomyces sp. XY58]|uniref:plasmid stabilization protein n=1 Tax=Streptomyces sp. XY58 TaxID=1519482 RepID=UPI0006ADFCB9|nr:plasmid stabilization protein [Streptomyces sp. XY58]KOU82386.1 plasmid stabilization protein [Streptomyces sp. XY58]
MPRGSSPKRERQYEHIKESGEKRGMSEDRAKEMASRTVNSGESKTASRSSTRGKSASQRGGEKSGGGGSSSGRTKDDLYQEAKKRGIEGRSTMTKQQLQNALGH